MNKVKDIFAPFDFDGCSILLVDDDQNIRICTTTSELGVQPYSEWYVRKWFVNHSSCMYNGASIVLYISKGDKDEEDETT